jgi:HEAT repeat protein
MIMVQRDIDQMRENRDIEGLIEALDDRNEMIRSDAALALGVLADERALSLLDRMRSTDESASVREAAHTAYTWVAGRLQELRQTQR